MQAWPCQAALVMPLAQLPRLEDRAGDQGSLSDATVTSDCCAASAPIESDTPLGCSLHTRAILTHKGRGISPNKNRENRNGREKRITMRASNACAPCRFGRTSVQAEIRPRFPLYGGWKTEFTFGYSLPLSAIMTKAKGQVQLEALFGTPFDHVVVDDLTVKVSLATCSAPHLAGC